MSQAVTLIFDFLSPKKGVEFIDRVVRVLGCPCLRYDKLVYVIAPHEEVYEVERIGHTLFGSILERHEAKSVMFKTLP